MAKVLVTQPNYDYTTRYISAWAQKAVDLAKEKGIKVTPPAKPTEIRKMSTGGQLLAF